ncbi:hypothetical protein OH77DRAFT_1412853 [Trametes cingulata]|nr:hypothetical protein OH77DRAFT_1412853 [Trametes cingulata]
MSSIDRVYAALKDLDAPMPDREALERLYKGRMAEVLDFVATSVKGRKETAAARDAIQMHREGSRGGGVGSQDETDPLYARVRRAEARVKNAQIALAHSEETCQKHAGRVLELEGEAAALQKELEDKRLSTLLLSVLERKEKIRKERFQEILRLLEQLRYSSGDDVAPPTPTSTAKPVRAEYTRDTLAALQAHSLRLSRLASLAKDSSLPALINEAETRLRAAVASFMELSVDDPQVLAAYETCVAVAKSRARLNVEYRSPLPDGEPPEDLQEMSDRIIEKEHELQSLADRAAALTLASARALQADAAFRQETAPQLKDALQTEAAASQGYVDALRLSIVNRPRAEAAGGFPGKDLSGGRSFEKTLSDIEQMFNEARDTESFVAAADALISPDPVSVQQHSEAAASYAKDEAEVSGRIQKLLARKAAKADAGRVLIEDIERLIAEVGIIAETHF